MYFFSEIFQIVTDTIMHLPFASLRGFYAKIVCKEFGKGSQISRHVHLMSPHRIKIGKNVFINRNATLDGRLGLIIGDSSDIGEFASVWTLQHDPASKTHGTKGGKTFIEDHVWVAPHAIVLPNVTLKRGTVVATAAVVTKSTEEKDIVAGVPAKRISKRENDLNYTLSYRIFF